MAQQRNLVQDDQQHLFKRSLIHRTSYVKGKTRINNKVYWDFSANDYLGLSSNNELLEAVKSVMSSMGSTGSRLLSGQNESVNQLENELADWLGKEAVLVFNSGYQCNVGVIPTFFDQRDLIIADKYIHASLIDGIKLSGAQFKRFSHLNYKHCHQLLESYSHHYRHVLIVSESVFSMDGDIADIDTLIDLKKRFNCFLMIDEAHALGVYGDCGEGLVGRRQNDVDFLVGTFGKAFGSAGAYVGVSDHFKQVLVNHCRSFIYSTALPLPVMYWNLFALRHISAAGQLRKQFLLQITYFRDSLKQLGVDVLGETHIVPLLGTSLERLSMLKMEFEKKGIWVPIIQSPTVLKGKERIRFSLSLDHSSDVLDQVIDVIKNKL